MTKLASFAVGPSVLFLTACGGHVLGGTALMDAESPAMMDAESSATDGEGSDAVDAGGSAPLDSGQSGSCCGVEVPVIIQNCPTLETLTPINPTATTSPPGNTSTLFAAAVTADGAKPTYTFSVIKGTGTLSVQTTAEGNVSSEVVFTCPTTPEVDTIQVVTSDSVGEPCPPSLTTGTTTVTCTTRDAGIVKNDSGDAAVE